MLRILCRLGMALAVTVLALTAPSQASGTGGYGFNRVTSPEASSQGTGYGLGWVALSGPGVNDPVVGNLFFYDNSAGNAADHMDIFSPGYTYPRGWAYGQFNGCAYAYTFANFYLEAEHPITETARPTTRACRKPTFSAAPETRCAPAMGHTRTRSECRSDRTPTARHSATSVRRCSGPTAPPPTHPEPTRSAPSAAARHSTSDMSPRTGNG
jgi:hypothetical protein